MPGKFDLSEMRMHLQSYVREISDLLTTPEEIQNYSNLCDALFRINSITNFYYTPRPDGTLPAMDQRAKMELRQSYQRALQEASPLLSDEDTGEIGLEMRRITRELAPLLQADADALDQVDVSKAPMRLPEIIGKGRELAVDLQNNPAPSVSGNSNTRQYIRVEGANGSETGYFTPSVQAAPTKDYQALLDRLQDKYPAYRTILDEMRTKNLQEIGSLHTLEENPFLPLQGQTVQEKRNELEAFWFTQFYQPLGFQGNQIGPLAQRSDYTQFTDELFSGLKPVRENYNKYIRGDGFLQVQEGSNLDRRNVAMHRMAGLLHKPELVAAARPMTVIQNGQTQSGTFMAEVHGTDINRVNPGDPILSYKPENLENPAVLPDIAAMQALDFICGNVDRHPGNFLLRFDPKDGANAKLTGISLIDNDMSFSHAGAEGRRYGSKFVRPDEMGVIGEDVYNAMRLMTREQMEMMLSDCGLTQDEITQAWDRKEALRKKVETDQAHFADKELGYTEAGKIRLVKEGEWENYSLQKLSLTHEGSQFEIIANLPAVAEMNLQRRLQEEEKRRIEDENRRLLGYPVAEQAQQNREPADGRIVGNGLQQNRDPLGIEADPDTVNLLIPSMASVPSVGDCLSKRYVLEFEENGEPKKVFFTPPQESSGRAGVQRIFADFVGQYPQYEQEFRKIQHYYSESELTDWYLKSSFDKMPASEMGFSKEEIEKLNEDDVFNKAVSQLSIAISSEIQRYAMLTGYGLMIGDGKRIELRNVAMSDVGEILGQPELLAKSRTAQVMADGKLMDGVVMDLAKGEDPGQFTQKKNHPATWITADQAKDCYNQPSALKQIADMQILDYVCLNVDRHSKNLFYQYEGLGTDAPKLIGVQGIDNDASFGTLVPNPDHRTNHLPALNEMKVISAEMWAKIQDEKTPALLEQKMRLRGLSDEEISAAKQRIQQIKDAVNNKKLRVVGEKEWATGENTFEKLSGGDKSNLFRLIRMDIVEKNASYAADREKLPADQRKPYVPKGLKTAKCLKTEGFGEKALQAKEFAALKNQAESDFLTEMKNRVKETPATEIQDEREFLRTAAQSVSNLNKKLNKADPFFHFTSRTYKNLISAGKDFEKLTAKLQKKLRNPDDVLSAKDSAKLIKAANKLKDCAAAYQAKKDAEKEGGKALDDIEEARVTVSGDVKASVNGLLESYQDTLSKQIAKEHPMHMVQYRLKQAQGDLSGLTGQKLYQKTAEILYYKSLTRIDLGVKKDQSLKNAMIPKEIRKQRDRLMELPAFQKLEKMPDAELRSLAAGKGADILMDRFITQVAKDMQAQKETSIPDPEPLQPKASEPGMKTL